MHNGTPCSLAPSLSVITVHSSQKDLIPGLDGLRAVAVVAVILFHGDISGWAPGGFLGVDVFFTLSGFLITSLLLKELNRTQTIQFGQFYERRLLRLAPAMLAVVIASALASLLWAEDARHHLQGDIPAALAYVSNWWQIHAEQSYFEMFGRPPLLQHFWSLAIEEQFYLIWPVLTLLAWRLAGRYGVLVMGLMLAAGSTAWMAHIAIAQGIPSEAGVNRIYLGTDTHAAGLLLGACLASLWSPWTQVSVASDAPSHASHPWGRDVLGILSMGGLLAAMTLVSESHEWLYRGGFSAVALLSCLVIVAACDTRTLLGRTLSHPMFTYVGARSYGLYLWHWPVFTLLRPGPELPDDPWLAFAIRCAITLALAEVSFAFIEQPIRRRPIRTWQFKGWAVAGATVAMCGTSVAMVFQGPLAVQFPGGFSVDAWSGLLRQGESTTSTEVSATTRPRTQPPMLCNAPASGIKPICLPATPSAAASVAVAASAPSTPIAVSASQSATTAASDAIAVPTAPATAASAPEPTPTVVDKDITMTAIGDSVLLGTQHHLNRTMPRVRVDAQVGRQGSDGLNRIRDLKRQGQLASTVLIHLGTNGYLCEKHMQSIMSELSDRQQVIFMNVHANRRWIEGNNQIIARLGARYPNVKVINWRSSAIEHPDYFVADGVHLNAKGIKAYASLIMQAGQGGMRPATQTVSKLSGPIDTANTPLNVMNVAQGPISKRADSPPPVKPAASSPKAETLNMPVQRPYPSMRVTPTSDRSEGNAAPPTTSSEEG